MAGRRAVRQHLLGDDIALELGAPLAAILFRPRHADPALGADLAGEGGGVFAAPAAGAERAGVDLLLEEGANLLAQLLALGRQLDRIELEGVGHRFSSRSLSDE